ncbi:MAG: hypothetical protein IK011_07370 [Bacteroidaceae bacterium]|nr:hypothetical protein [Bacteroidaceae bacterium]MBR4779687.1 hypothetical protein [Bacteroidaceae bacterium]
MALLALFASCGGDDCVINNTVTATMNFYMADGNPCQIMDTLTVSVVRERGDSVVLNRKLGASSLIFPLGYSNACDTFVFRFARMGVSDSVFIRHDNYPYFISLDCGTAMFHTLTSVDCTHHLMQSIQITHPEINYDAQENVQLVFGD